MVNNRRKLKIVRKRIRMAGRLAALRRALKAKKVKKQVITRKTPRTLQIATIRDTLENGISKEKMLECAEKLQKKYFKAQKTMCSHCKGQPLTPVFTSFKIEGQEEKIEMRALIVDLERMAEAGFPGIEKYLDIN